MISLAPAILRTLQYSDHFDFPLTLGEINRRLIAPRPCTLKQVSNVLSDLESKRLVAHSRNFYYLPGRSSVVAARLARRKLSTAQQARAAALAGKLGQLPGVLAVYLTGSLAMANSDQSSDIDFMIITHNKRLWTTRLLLTLYTEFLGLRRRPLTHYTAGKLCLNLYLSPLSYLLPSTKRSLYTAYELVQAMPLYDPHNTRFDLLSANSWIKNYLPNFSSEAQTPLQNTNANTAEQAVSGKSSFWSGANNLFNLFESLAYHLQLWYMRPKLTREYITRDSAFFHPKSPAPRV